MLNSDDRKELPPSVVRWIDPFLIAALIIGVYALCEKSSLSALQISLLIIAAVIAVMVPIEFIQAPWHATPRPDIPVGLTLKRTAIKTLGIMLGVGMMVAAWFLIQEYRGREFQPLFETLPYALAATPFVVALTVFYTEWRLGPSEDHSWQFGLLALGRWREVDWTAARTGLFGWIVKGFFLPLNFIGAVHGLEGLRGVETRLFTMPWPQAQSTVAQIIFTLLVFAITPGYLFSARILGTENRRIDQTAFGWFVTLLCYSPLNNGTGASWFHFRNYSNIVPGNLGTGDEPWVGCLGASGAFSYGIGGLILLFALFHYWGEATCHIRSSHLSHRGIITNGAFRYCKHPVYASKCLAWGLIWLPFLTGGTVLDDVRQSIAFLAFCFVFVLRGWIEERLLSNDPAYVAYALWMDRHSVFRGVGRAIPFFKYSWRLDWWTKNGQVKPSTTL